MGEQLEYIDRERRWKREQLPDRSWKRKYATLKARHDELLALAETVRRDIDTITASGRECPFCFHTFHHDDTCLYEKVELAIAKAKSDA